MIFDKLTIYGEFQIRPETLGIMTAHTRSVSRTHFYWQNHRYELFNGAVIFVKRGKTSRKVEVDLNPNHFSSKKAVLKFLDLIIVDFDPAVVIPKKVHLNVDLVGVSPDLVKQEINPSWLRKVFKVADEESWKSGKFDERRASFYFGSKKRKQLVMYDAFKRHGGVDPTTRIEYQMNEKNIHKYESLRDLLDHIPGMKPFSMLKFYSYFSNHMPDAKNRMKADHLTLSLEKYGYRLTFQRFKKLDGHYDDSYDAVLKQFKKKDYKLDKLFQRRAKKFFAAGVGRADREMFRDAKEIMKAGKASAWS
ncbi:hypothetical protein WDW86_00525 [Bdellovibrionota bacterium FG-2]